MMAQKEQKLFKEIRSSQWVAPNSDSDSFHITHLPWFIFSYLSPYKQALLHGTEVTNPIYSALYFIVKLPDV